MGAHLRRGALDEVVPALRGRYWLRLDSIVIGELFAGARSKVERATVAKLVRPFEQAGRIVHPEPTDLRRAGLALGRLRAGGRSLSNPGGALLDGTIGELGARLGAKLVTTNLRDFEALAQVLPLHVSSLEDFRAEIRRTR